MTSSSHAGSVAQGPGTKCVHDCSKPKYASMSSLSIFASRKQLCKSQFEHCDRPAHMTNSHFISLWRKPLFRKKLIQLPNKVNDHTNCLSIAQVTNTWISRRRFSIQTYLGWQATMNWQGSPWSSFLPSRRWSTWRSHSWPKWARYRGNRRERYEPSMVYSKNPLYGWKYLHCLIVFYFQPPYVNSHIFLDHPKLMFMCSSL